MWIRTYFDVANAVRLYIEEVEEQSPYSETKIYWYLYYDSLIEKKIFIQKFRNYFDANKPLDKFAKAIKERKHYVDLFY